MWLILFFLLLTPVQAQESTNSATLPPRIFNQYQRDYLYQYSLYNQAYLNYINKREVHTKYGTITTKQEKFAAAVNALNARNQTLKTYLTALRVLLDEYQSANPTATEKLKIDISKWEDWFNEQLMVVPSINNDDDLKKWIDDFKNKYISIQSIIYTSLVQHEINLRSTSLTKLQNLANDIKNNPQIKPESQQWLNSLTIKSDLVNTSLNNSLAYTKKGQSLTKFNNFYPSSRSEIAKANNYLREISTDLKLTIIKFIKNDI